MQIGSYKQHVYLCISWHVLKKTHMLTLSGNLVFVKLKIMKTCKICEGGKWFTNNFHVTLTKGKKEIIDFIHMV